MRLKKYSLRVVAVMAVAAGITAAAILFPSGFNSRIFLRSTFLPNRLLLSKFTGWPIKSPIDSLRRGNNMR